MKILIPFFLFLPSVLLAQEHDSSKVNISCTEIRAFNIIFTNSIQSNFDSESTSHIQEFELTGTKGKELVMLLGVSPIPCTIIWTKKEYKKFTDDFGYHFQKKFDKKVESYCECMTENYSIFVWSLNDGYFYGVLLTPTIKN